MIVNGKRIKGLQAYKVKGKKEWLYVWLNDCLTDRRGLFYTAYITLWEGEELPNHHGSVADMYLAEFCTPQSYTKLPDYVQDHLRKYVAD